MITPRRLGRLSFVRSIGYAVSISAALIGLALQSLQAFPPQHGKSAKPYALIAGTVWGPDDRPVYGVKVKIRRAKDKKAKWELVSDHMGEFAQRVPAGESDYIIWADLKGLKFPDGKPVHLVKEITVHIYGEEREDTGLHLSH